MVFFKCKMCGGNLEVNENMSVGVCDSCGTQQTLPRLNNDKKTNLYVNLLLKCDKKKSVI